MEHNPFSRRAVNNHERFIMPSNPVCPPMLSAFPVPDLTTPFPVFQPIITWFVPPDQSPSQPEISDPDTPFPTIQPIITGFVPPDQRPSQPEIEESDKTVYNDVSIGSTSPHWNGSESSSNSSY